MGKNKLFWPLGMAKKKFWHAMGFELCTPGLAYYLNTLIKGDHLIVD